MNHSILRFVSAEDGTRLAWYTHVGQSSEAALRAKRSIVLTNGLSTTDNFWGPIVAGLAGDYRLHHWNYRAHGKSERARSRDYAIRTHVADLVRVTETVRDHGTSENPPVHIAFSMGVHVLLELYRARPDLVGAMVLVAGGPDHPHSSNPLFDIPGVRRALRGALRIASPIVPHVSPIVRRLGSARALYPLARTLGAIGENAPREELEHFFRSVGAMDLEGFWGSMSSLLDAHASDVLAQVKVPVLIIAPERDVLAAQKDLWALKKGIATAEWMSVPKTTHAIMLEAGDIVALRIGEFLVTNPSPAQ